MTTSDPRDVDSPEFLPGAVPDPALIAKWANEFFRAFPGEASPTGVVAAPTAGVAPSAPTIPPVVTSFDAPSDVGGSAPSAVAQTTPPPTGAWGTPPPVPNSSGVAPIPATGGAPEVPPERPPVGPTSFVPAATPAEPDWNTILAGLTTASEAGSVTTFVPDLGDSISFVPDLGSPLPDVPGTQSLSTDTIGAPHDVSGVPHSDDVPHDFGHDPHFDDPLASPVAMPTGDQLGTVPTTLSAAFGFANLAPLSEGSIPDLAEPVPTSIPGNAVIPSVPSAPAQTSPEPAAPTFDNLEFRPDLVPGLETGPQPFEPHVLRRDFPILKETVNGKPLIWLDNAATTQKPQVVLDRLAYFYEHENSNIHRAAHTLAARATDAYEAARDKVRRFLNAGSTEEIIFVRGTTEGINLVAKTWGKKNIGEGDEILLTWLEHHANIVPWQQLAAETGAVIKVAPITDNGELIVSEFTRLLGPRTKLVAFTSVNNSLGTVNPAAELVELAHRNGSRVLVDGAQSVAHLRTDVQALDADFFVFSGHKVFGPTGIGAVYGKREVLADMPPWEGGGNMIADVTFEKTVYQPPPGRFEAGTGNIADAVGLGAALDYVTAVGIDNLAAYEHELLVYGTAGLRTVPGLHLIGTAPRKASVMSFVLDGYRTEDVGSALNQEGIAVRSGHHCAQPSLRRLGVETTVRPSLALYNTTEEIDCLVDALRRLVGGRLSQR